MEYQVETKPTTNGKGTLLKRPKEYDNQSWTRISVETIRSGQPRPYADSVYEYLVTFEGGSRSIQEGWDLPFGTRISEERARPIIKSLTRGWVENPRWSDNRLESLEIIEGDNTHTTFKVVIREPYLD
jgi:hypothetical protein